MFNNPISIQHLNVKKKKLKYDRETCDYKAACFSEQYLVCVWNLEKVNIMFGRWKSAMQRFSRATKPVQTVLFSPLLYL